MLVIVDYGMGNLRSVEKAFEACGERPKISSDPHVIEKADKIVLPGVGAFTQAMAVLKKRKLIGLIRDKIKNGTPYLGLCLGLQLLFSESQEGRGAKGLGIIEGPVKRFSGKLKVPHMGWNTINPLKKNCPLFQGISKEAYFYFVHSYYGMPADKSWVLASTDYGIKFCSAVWKGHVFATQFHPEKSQAEGLRMIKNFSQYDKKGANDPDSRH